MVNIIDFNSEKGGVTKTTSSYIIANLLATKNSDKITIYTEQRKAHKVLLIDGDFQCNLTEFVLPEFDPSVGGVIDAIIEGDATKYIQQSPQNENLYILPATRKQRRFDEFFFTDLINLPNPRKLLENALKCALKKFEFDFIVIDNCPSLNELKSQLLSLDLDDEHRVIVPLQIDPLSVSTLLNMNNTIEHHKQFNKQLYLYKAVPVLLDNRASFDRALEQGIREQVPDMITNTSILKKVRIKNIMDEGFDESKAENRRVMQYYRELLVEITKGLNINEKSKPITSTTK